MSVSLFQAAFERAKALADCGNTSEALGKYRALIFTFSEKDDPEESKWVEMAVSEMSSIMVNQKDQQSLAAMHKEFLPALVSLPRAKTAKIVRSLIDSLAKIPGSGALQVQACKDCISWCVEGKRAFLRQRMEAKLASLYIAQSKAPAALELLSNLTIEVRKMDDKVLLVELLVLETRAQFALRNIAKAKASLTAAKANANAIHCPVSLQADIDMLSGVLNAREGDFKTSYSYFYEAFEALNQLGDKHRSLNTLCYMSLTKIMADLPAEAILIASSKNGLKFAGPELSALTEVAKSLKQRSLKDFEAVIQKHSTYLSSDPVIAYHLTDLNERLLEQNLLKLIEPYSRVEIAYLAHLINLSIDRVQRKLSELILDGKLTATLDQGVGVLILFEKNSEEVAIYDDVITCIENTSQALDSLYVKSHKLVA